MSIATHEFQFKRERIRVDAWGPDGLRLRITQNPHFSASAGALVASEAQGALEVEAGESKGAVSVRHGELRLEFFFDGAPSQPKSHHAILARRVSDGEVLFQVPGERRLRAKAGRYQEASFRCAAMAGERFYGLGQHPHGRLNQKGCVIDLRQKNTEVAIPWLYSNRGYGLLWNHPGTGRVELAENHTRWVADATEEIDIWLTAAATPAEALAKYADATGHPAKFPDFASGFWQCKLRYASQEELLSVAREHKRRGHPLSVIVADYFHWDKMGEWRFDPKCWPDPAAMVRELRGMGTELMVSVWPTINPGCTDFAEMEARDLMLQTERGVSAVTHFLDTYQDERLYLHHLDPTNPEARAFHWNKAKENYYRHGIRIFWLDACEPELNPFDFDNLRYHAGPGEAVSCLFPKAHQQAYFEGLQGEGETEIITLGRSAWAGSQRYGAAVWSGDIPSTFESLAKQVRAGLNMAMSGIPWWCTDIGGFTGGDIRTDYFRELIVRWFQYGVFCPIFRLHGVREPESFKSGGPNEIWEFGEEAYAIIGRLLELREALRPYLHEQMDLASKTGLPPMRPLFVDFPEDPRAWEVEDQFMFGPDILVAPVTEQGATEREVYLPEGVEWVEVSTAQTVPTSGWKRSAAPVQSIPVFARRRREIEPLLAWAKHRF